MRVELKSAWALWCALALLLGLAAPARAQLGRTQHIHPRLIAETSTPAPGQTVALALVMTPDKGWHGYWKNPGDAGVATKVDWALPPGVTVGDFVYPVPQRLTIAGLMNYVYEGEHALLTRLTVPKDAKPGTLLPISAKAEWLACTEEVCVPERGTVALNLTVGNGAIDPAIRARFDAWRAKLPKPLGATGHFEGAGKTLRIGVPLPASVAVADPYFYPLTGNAVDYAAPQRISRNGDTLVIETAAKGTPATLDGVLEIGPGMGLEIHAVPGAVPAAGEPIGAPAAAWSWRTVLLALGGALLGGLILNIMPCVFPILSLKALSLARANVDAREARREALAYTGGVIVTCLLLGGALLALRAGGAAVGWAFQLQDPRVIAFLLLLVTAIALNLAGLFEVGAIGGGERLAGRGGAAGAFWTGALAAFVATPCTGPFMAAALGAALILPAAAALAIFAGLGLGLALPFLAIGFVPALRRALPKPGHWMETFRRILAIPMLVTALGLAWILGRQAGPDGMALGLLSALLGALALWWAGARQRRGKGALPAVPVGLVALALVLVIAPAPMRAEAAGGALAAQPFSEARLAQATGAGRPAFVYFTADWCLTCKVNEKAAIERPEVAAAFKRANVAVLVGDWTGGDPAIGRFLEQHGRSGVPLYLYYRPGRSEPEILPQVLTPGMLVGLIR